MLCSFLAGAWFALTLPVPGPPLQFQDARLTQGFLGPERASAEYYRQDEVCLRYVLTGVHTDADGQFDVTLENRLTDPGGALAWQNTAPAKGSLLLGGGTVVGHMDLPLDHPYLPPGDWTMAVTATDHVAHQSTTITRKFTYKPLELAVVRPAFSTDEQFKVPVRQTAAVAGQPLFFRGKVVGYAKDEGSRGNAALDIAVHFLDAEGHDVGKPYEMHVEQKITEPVNPLECCDFNMGFVPNRAGKFTLRVEAHDRIGKKTATLDVPLHVQE
jgi:hypothetical protein